MRRRWVVFSVVCPALVSACAVVADLGERTLGDPNAINTPDAGDTDTSRPKKDSGPAKDVEEPEGPRTYCEGIVLYASFDGKLTGDRGGESTFSSGSVTTSSQGKFGGALSLVGDNSSEGSAGAAHYFLATEAGNPWPEAAGSIAVWFRFAPGQTPLFPVLYRPTATLPTDGFLQTAAPAYFLSNNIDQTGKRSGLYERGGDQLEYQVLVFPEEETAPYLRAGDYNHYFVSWQKNDTPTAAIAINGGLGTVFNGTGGEYPEGAAPYRAVTSRPWVSEGPPATLRLGGHGTNSPQGTFDDLVVWNRVLSFDEAAALYSAGKPVGELCDLR